MRILKLYYPEERLRLPQEDAWAIDEKNLAFAVADGVHLLPGIEYHRGKEYPAPSPSGRLAREFCNNFIKFQKRSGIKTAFAKANRSVFRLNKKRAKLSTFLKAGVYYAATAVVGRIKSRIFEWMGICDSSVTVLDSRGKILLFHTDHLHHNDFDPLLSEYFHLDQSYMLRTLFRNALSPQGKKLGYGVITGEKAAEKYAWSGKRKMRKGEVIVFATDGFEAYLQDDSFRKALLRFNKKEVEQAVITLEKHHKNNSEFVSEGTLIAVYV
ncbi:MAG: hypothetical protein AAB655_00795, partial [Patescibacteria group bacterium]